VFRISMVGVAVALSAASSALASPYAFVSADRGAAGRIIMADRATIHRDGELTRVSAFMIFRDVQKGGETYRKVAFEFQCQADRYRMVGLAAYSDTGAVLGQENAASPFAVTAPDTSIGQLQRETCSPTPLADTAIDVPAGVSEVQLVQDMRKYLSQP
jgi:hypothetical protein